MVQTISALTATVAAEAKRNNQRATALRARRPPVVRKSSSEIEVIRPQSC
jgi:hypothetical protein